MYIILILLIALVLLFCNKKGYAVHKKPGLYLLIPSVLFAPIALYFILMGLSGSDKQSFLLIGIGYVAILIFSFTSLWKPKLLSGAGLGILLLGIGLWRNNQFWTRENDDLCAKVRADTFCIETTTSFNCSENSSIGAFNSSNTCAEKYSGPELDKMNETKRTLQIQQAAIEGGAPEKKMPNLEYVGRANQTYEAIVKKIIASENPAELNFEDQLVAIYNCINNEHDDMLKAEAYGTMTLRSLAKTEEQIERYRTYVASKGRIITPGLNIAAIPAGDKNMSCASLLAD